MDHHHTTTGHESTSQSLPSETRLHHVKGNLMHLTHIVKAEPREHNKNIPKSSENDPSAEGLAKDLANDRAFEAYHESELSPSNTSNKVGSKVNAIAKVAKAIANPRNVTKRSAAKTLANRDSPFITLKEDESLVKAVDSLEHAESEERDGRTCNEEVKRLSDELNQLETRREQTRVSWTMSRYVHRARVIPAETCERPIFPTSATGSSKPAIGARISWLGHYLLWLSSNFTKQYVDPDNNIANKVIDKPAIMEDAERILVASEAWQEWLLDLRAIYRWEDRVRTGKWCLVYTLLWFLNRVYTFVICQVIYGVYCNRAKHESLNQVRRSQSRQNSGGKVMRMTDLVAKHGPKGWIDPMVEGVGPLVQVQIRDLADFLEIVVNFYDWENPSMTLATLFLFSAVLILAVFGSTDFNLRVINLNLIVFFFGCRPIASIYPRYRHIVSPVRWIFWNIPTNAELSFAYLQERVKKHRINNLPRDQAKVDSSQRGTLAKDNTTSHHHLSDDPLSFDGDYDDFLDDHGCWSDASLNDRLAKSYLRSFPCLSDGKPGHVCLSTREICFVAYRHDAVRWTYGLQEIVEMNKVDKADKAKKPSYKAPRGLTFLFADGTSRHIKARKSRDEIFNDVVGLSGLRWQHLPLAGQLDG